MRQPGGPGACTKGTGLSTGLGGGGGGLAGGGDGAGACASKSYFYTVCCDEGDIRAVQLRTGAQRLSPRKGRVCCHTFSVHDGTSPRSQFSDICSCTMLQYSLRCMYLHAAGS